MAEGSTPMMKQYHGLRTQIPKDALLLFRLGDFYELFFGDAEEGSRLLNLTLTKRNGIPMCGLPFHGNPVSFGQGNPGCPPKARR